MSKIGLPGLGLQWRQRQIRTTHTFKPYGQLASPTSNQPRNANLHPTRTSEVGTVSSTRNPLTYFQAIFGKHQDHPMGVMVVWQDA